MQHEHLDRAPRSAFLAGDPCHLVVAEFADQITRIVGEQGDEGVQFRGDGECFPQFVRHRGQEVDERVATVGIDVPPVVIDQAAAQTGPLRHRPGGEIGEHVTQTRALLEMLEHEFDCRQYEPATGALRVLFGVGHVAP